MPASIALFIVTQTNGSSFISRAFYTQGLSVMIDTHHSLFWAFSHENSFFSYSLANSLWNPEFQAFKVLVKVEEEFPGEKFEVEGWHIYSLKSDIISLKYKLYLNL